MKYFYLILLLIIFSCQKKGEKVQDKSVEITIINKKKDSYQESSFKELSYIKRRNSNVKYFKDKEINDDISNEMNDSILLLERHLKEILTNLKLEEIKEKGRINLETFFPELGFGMLDGLFITREKETIICTSNYIFSEFYSGYQLNKLLPSELEDVFQKAFASDYAITNIHSFKVENFDVPAYCVISIDGQDIGPFPPNALYVLISIENNVYLIQRELKEFKSIQNCTNLWGDLNGESEEEIWKDYCKCYAKEFKNNEQYSFLEKEINEMLEIVVK